MITFVLVYPSIYTHMGVQKYSDDTENAFQDAFLQWINMNASHIALIRVSTILAAEYLQVPMSVYI